MTGYFIPLLNMVISLFLLLMTGFILRKLGLIKDDTSAFLSKLLVTVLQPMLIIHSLYSAPFSVQSLKTGLSMIGISLCVHLFMAAVAFVACLGFKKADEQAISRFSMVFGNVGFIGFPILDVLIPENGRFLGAFFLIGFHLTLWSVGILLFALKHKHIKVTAKKLLLNYGTVPCFIGFALYLALGAVRSFAPEFAMPAAAVTFTKYLSDASVPISLIIAGSLLATRTPKQIFGDPKSYYTAFFKLIVSPLLVCTLMHLLGFGADTVLLVTTLCATPVAAMVTVVSQLYGVNPGYSSMPMSLTTVMCVATLPVVVPIANFIVSL